MPDAAETLITISRGELEAVRDARLQAREARWATLVPSTRDALGHVDAILRRLSRRALDHLGTGFECGLTAGFHAASGVRGAIPKDLWLTIFRADAGANGYMPQIYLIVSERGIEFGFAPAIHPTDFSNPTLKARLRERAGAIFEALPAIDSSEVDRVSRALSVDPQYRLRSKARLAPSEPDGHTDLRALWSYLKSPEGARWGAASICKYVLIEDVASDGVDVWKLLAPMIDLFAPILTSTRVDADADAIEVEELEASGAARAETATDALVWLLDRYPPLRQRPYCANEELERMFATLADSLGLSPSRRLAIEWSYGKGKWAAVPWLAIMDPRSTTTTQRGIYVVFLFRADGSGVYLALGQGITEITKEEGITKGHEQLRARSASIAASFASDAARRGFETSSPMDLRSELPRPRAYEQGAIAHKLYGRDTLPTDADVRADVEFLLGAYARILDTNAASADENTSGARRTWLMALGENARYLEPLHAGGLIAIGWDHLGDLRRYTSQEAIAEAMRAHDGVPGSRKNDALACFNFAREMRPGDRVLIKRGSDTILGGAIVTGDYEFNPTRPEYHHVRRVEWTHRGEWSFPGLPIKTLTEFTPFPDMIGKIEALLESASAPTARPIIEAQEDLRAYTIDDVMDGVFMPRESVERLIQVWRAKKNLILQGPPGVGKSFLARRLAYALMGKEDPSRLQVVQFHQSYAYEDFIQGFRPGSAGFELRDGPFLEFCRRAGNDPGATFVFVIDEINRGNLSKILGETLMLLEADKRSGEWGVSLSYASRDAPRFHVPANVHLLGLMNTADRSLAVVDYALRRRFAFTTLEPAIASPAFRTHLIESGVSTDVAARVVKTIGELNEAIALDTVNLGPGFRVGHSFFCRGPAPGEDSGAWWRTIVETELLPLLEEYYFGHPSGPSTIEDWTERLLANV